MWRNSKKIVLNVETLHYCPAVRYLTRDIKGVKPGICGCEHCPVSDWILLSVISFCEKDDVRNKAKVFFRIVIDNITTIPPDFPSNPDIAIFSPAIQGPLY